MQYYVLEKPAGSDRYDYLILYRAKNTRLWRHTYFRGEEKLFGGRFVPLASQSRSSTTLYDCHVNAMISQHRHRGWHAISRNAYWCGADHGLTFSLGKALGTVDFFAPVASLWRAVVGVLGAMFTAPSVTASVRSGDHGDDSDDDDWDVRSFKMFGQGNFGFCGEPVPDVPGFVDIDPARDFFWSDDIFDSTSDIGGDSMCDDW